MPDPFIGCEVTLRRECYVTNDLVLVQYIKRRFILVFATTEKICDNQYGRKERKRVSELQVCS
jgi:hypothetical protein